MNVTFLIGNGFDLNLGLKTGYKDFLKYYTNKYRSKPPLTELFVEEILQDEDLWSYAEKAFGEYTARYDGTKRSVEEYCGCHTDFCNELGAYLSAEADKIKEPNRLWAGKFLHAIGNLNKGIEINETFDGEIAAFLLPESTTKPIEIQYNVISFNYTDVFDRFYEMGREYYATRRIHRHIVPVSEEEVCYRDLEDNVVFNDIIHIHGYTDRDMVLGVNDKSQIANIALFEKQDEEFLSQIIKQQTNAMNGSSADHDAYSVLKQSDIIYIYGMSLGETDKIWWERICEVLRTRQHSILIIHAYDAKKQGNINTDYYRTIRKRRDEFLKYNVYNRISEYGIKEFTIQKHRICVTGDNIFSELSNYATVKHPKESMWRWIWAWLKWVFSP